MKAAITIVVATYHRPAALRNAIRSARAQTMPDWRMIVIGDCCSDETESVVREFDDARIRFANLPERFGEQAGPNSVGMALADTGYLAFLNQDDLWLPHHLDHALGAMAKADLYWARAAFFDNRGPRADAAIFTEAHPKERSLEEACDSPRWYIEPMSGWVMRTTLAQEIGPMGLSSKLATVPIDDYVFRLWQAAPRFTSGSEIALLKEKMNMRKIGGKGVEPHYAIAPLYAESWLDKMEAGSTDLLLEEIEEDIWLAAHLGLSRTWACADGTGGLSRTRFYEKTGIDAVDASLLAAGSSDEPGFVISQSLRNRTGETLASQPPLEQAINAARTQLRVR